MGSHPESFPRISPNLPPYGYVVPPSPINDLNGQMMDFSLGAPCSQSFSPMYFPSPHASNINPHHLSGLTMNPYYANTLFAQIDQQALGFSARYSQEMEAAAAASQLGAQMYDGGAMQPQQQQLVHPCFTTMNPYAIQASSSVAPPSDRRGSLPDQRSPPQTRGGRIRSMSVTQPRQTPQHETPQGTRGERKKPSNHHVSMFTIPSACVLPCELRPLAAFYVQNDYPYHNCSQLSLSHMADSMHLRNKYYQ